MGQHTWLLLATVLTELLIIVKWSRGQFPEPAPYHIKVGWAIGSAMLVGYPLLKVTTPFSFALTERDQLTVFLLVY